MLTRIKIERLRRGWTQRYVGEHAGVCVPDISRIETGRMRPYPGQAERLGKLFALDPSELQQAV